MTKALRYGHSLGRERLFSASPFFAKQEQPIKQSPSTYAHTYYMDVDFMRG